MSTVKERKKKNLEAKQAVRRNKVEEKKGFRYLMTVAYDGSGYGGYAKQMHGKTIQNVLESALKTYFKTAIKTTEASRTDSAVHALCQKVMFDSNQQLAVKKVLTQLNELLPKEIMITDLVSVDLDFHCRYDVVDKTYEYVIMGQMDVRRHRYAWHVEGALDVKKMREAGEILVGKHDFSTFKSAKATTDTSVRTVHFLEILEEKDDIIIRINADGFLYNMVRLMVKALVDVGTGNKEVADIDQLLKAKQKPANFESAPAQGLTLVEINYGK